MLSPEGVVVKWALVWIVGSLLVGCTAQVSGGAAGSMDGGGDGNPVPDGGFLPYEKISAAAAARKVKGVLTGLAPTDDEIASAGDQDALQDLIDTWMDTPEFERRMLFFFGNTFQQSSPSTNDFDVELRSGFDIGLSGSSGDEAYSKVFANLKESFARTAWAIVDEGRPFSEVLTTRRFMMTTALKSLYAQIELEHVGNGREDPGPAFVWYLDEQNLNIPLADSLDPKSDNFMHFSDGIPNDPATRDKEGCRGKDGYELVEYRSRSKLFQLLLGMTSTGYEKFDDPTGEKCQQHNSKPYFTPEDLSDWQWVAIEAGNTAPQPWDLPALRTVTTLKLGLPRVGFFTTPTFLAQWNTNDSNKHRVTVNQTLLVALGQGFTSAGQNFSNPSQGADEAHSTDGVCASCHNGLDPMPPFFENSYDFDDRTSDAAHKAGRFVFDGVDEPVADPSPVDFANFLLQAKDTQGGDAVSRFALAMAQKLCFFGDSAACSESDPELRRIAHAFEKSDFDFRALVREMFASPLITGLEPTETFEKREVVVSIARRDQLCQALSNRFDKPDICGQHVAMPIGRLTPMARRAGSIVDDAFSRGSESPITPYDPGLFYRAATEQVCEAIAIQLVDQPDGTYESSAVDDAIEDLVSRLLGYPPADEHHADAVTILKEHYTAAKEENKESATDSLRSTFSLACQSPTFLSVGL